METFSQILFILEVKKANKLGFNSKRNKREPCISWHGWSTDRVMSCLFVLVLDTTRIRIFVKKGENSDCEVVVQCQERL